MLNDNLTVLIDKFLELKSSTTFFLEEIRGEKLWSLVESQYETVENNHTIINRIVKLYFESPQIPVLYCESRLVKEQMTQGEYEHIVDGELPIGRIFHRFNQAESIVKKEFAVNRCWDNRIAKNLNVKNQKVYNKCYDYWVSGRKVGVIHEYFNEESLERI